MISFNSFFSEDWDVFGCEVSECFTKIKILSKYLQNANQKQKWKKFFLTSRKMTLIFTCCLFYAPLYAFYVLNYRRL